MYSVTFFRKSCRLWDNVEKCFGTRRAADDNMAHAREWWISKTTQAQEHALARAHTHTHVRTHARSHTHARAHTKKYVALTNSPRHQWFSGSASLLRYTHIACLVYQDLVSSSALRPTLTMRNSYGFSQTIKINGEIILWNRLRLTYIILSLLPSAHLKNIDYLTKE